MEVNLSNEPNLASVREIPPLTFLKKRQKLRFLNNIVKENFFFVKSKIFQQVQITYFHSYLSFIQCQNTIPSIFVSLTPSQSPRMHDYFKKYRVYSLFRNFVHRWRCNMFQNVKLQLCLFFRYEVKEFGIQLLIIIEVFCSDLIIRLNLSLHFLSYCFSKIEKVFNFCLCTLI